MGGRGSSNATAKGQQPIVMSEEEYLTRAGVGTPFSDYSIDKTRLPHNETQRQREARLRETLRVGREYSQRRKQAREEYQSVAYMVNLEQWQIKNEQRLYDASKTRLKRIREHLKTNPRKGVI